MPLDFRLKENIIADDAPLSFLERRKPNTYIQDGDGSASRPQVQDWQEDW